VHGRARKRKDDPVDPNPVFSIQEVAAMLKVSRWSGSEVANVSMLDAVAENITDAGRSGRAHRKDLMARRRYQEGHLLIRGKRKKQWVARWREDMTREDGALDRIQRTVVLGAVSELTRREALNELKKRLGPMNEGSRKAQATPAVCAVNRLGIGLLRCEREAP
jgi:hypothetical protein